MKKYLKICTTLTALVVTSMTSNLFAANASQNGSTVKAFFGSQSNIYTDSDPTGASWGAVPIGAYTAGAVLPNAPASPTPQISVAGPNNFQTVVGWTSIFNDNLGTNSYTAAQSNIADNFNATPTLVADQSIAIPNWRLFQAPAATGYAYEQLNFASNYIITNSGPGLVGSSPSIPFFINGSVQPGGSAYAQFDAVINYTFFPATVNAAGVITSTGPSQNLGNLNYTWTQTGGGVFNTSILSSGSLISTNPGIDGILALSGHAWLAGDPFEINITTVPEPTSFGMIAVVGLFALRRRK